MILGLCADIIAFFILACMAILPILQYPDPRLSQTGKPVDIVDASVRKVVEDMFETHYAQENCAALAATQLGIPLRITVIDFSEEKNSPLCLINPTIVSRSGETNTKEGCMSVKGLYEKVKRAEVIRVQALDQHSKELDFEADGFMAKCIQHELDHLDGILFINRLSPLRQKMVSRRFKFF